MHGAVRGEAGMQWSEERVGREEGKGVSHGETIVGGSNWRVTEKGLGGF